MVLVKIFKVGFVPNNFIEYVENLIKNFYESVNADVDYVEVYVYENSVSKRSFLLREGLELGVMVLGDYIVSHDAWRGWPRIHIDYELCENLSREYLDALLIHEATHSILHGSIAYYLISFSKELVEKFGLEKASEIVYLASTIVKDLDVHRFLLEKNMDEHIEKYFEYSIKELVEKAECINYVDILNMLKILAPCVFIKCDIDKISLSEECKQIFSRFAELAPELNSLCKNDLSCKVNTLINRIITPQNSLKIS